MTIFATRWSPFSFSRISTHFSCNKFSLFHHEKPFVVLNTGIHYFILFKSSDYPQSFWLMYFWKLLNYEWISGWSFGPYAFIGASDVTQTGVQLEELKWLVSHAHIYILPIELEIRKHSQRFVMDSPVQIRYVSWFVSI